jgi:integrase
MASASSPGAEGLHLRHTKGRRDRSVPLLPGRLVALLKTARRAAAADGPENRGGERWVFPGRGSGPWSYDAALEAWHDLCARAGVEAVPHQLRHTRATELVRQGISPHALQRAMGWVKLDQSLLYVKVTDEELRRELGRVQEGQHP